MFSLFLFARLRKRTLSQRVETCNGVKWRLASPGDSGRPAKPTVCDGNVLTERRSVKTVHGEIEPHLMKHGVRVNPLSLAEAVRFITNLYTRLISWLDISLFVWHRIRAETQIVNTWILWIYSHNLFCIRRTLGSCSVSYECCHFLSVCLAFWTNIYAGRGDEEWEEETEEGEVNRKRTGEGRWGTRNDEYVNNEMIWEKQKEVTFFKMESKRELGREGSGKGMKNVKNERKNIIENNI